MLTPYQISERTVSVSLTKIERPILSQYLLGIFAGMFIALAGVATSIASVTSGKLAGSLVFCLGLVLVLIAGSELFTGNCLILMAVFKKKVSISQMLKNWGIVYLGNLTGALIIATLAVYSGVLDGISQQLLSTTATKSTLPFTEALLRGVLCNILVCLAVWMGFASDDACGKILSVIFPISAFVLCGFEHSVANMYFLPVGALMALRTGAEIPATVWQMLFGNLLPVTLGNILGGGLFVAGGYYAALKEENK